MDSHDTALPLVRRTNPTERFWLLSDSGCEERVVANVCRDRTRATLNGFRVRGQALPLALTKSLAMNCNGLISLV